MSVPTAERDDNATGQKRSDHQDEREYDGHAFHDVTFRSTAQGFDLHPVRRHPTDPRIV
jgi:hypothetical protein